MNAIEPVENERSNATEDALRLVVDTTPALIHTGRPDGYLDYFNQRWLDLLGCSLDALCGWRWTNFIHPDDVAGMVQTWHAALESGEPFEAEARVRRADGEYRLFLHRKVPMRDGEGTIVKWFGSSLDIEDRKRGEEAMLQKEKDLQELIDAVPQHIGVARSDGRPLFVNKAALEYHGLTRDEWFDAAAPDAKRNTIVHPDDLEQVLSAHNKGVSSGEPYGFEVRMRRKDGEYRRFLFRSNPHRDDSGHVIRWYSTRTDIEDLKRAEDALRLSEAYMAHAQQITRVGSWAYKPPDICEYWSAEMFRMFGFDPSKGYPSNDEVASLIHPEDRQRADEAITQHFKHGRIFDLKYRIVRSDGQLRVIHDFGTPVFENGVVTRFVGACLDITEQENALEEIRRLKDELYKENIVLREEINRTSMFEEVLGTSVALQTVLALAAKVAPTDSTVLITGETGTGKELIARAIHKRSKRSERAFVSVNCAAIPTTLIMSELFGHEKGAFTGAIQRRLGRFELAEGGTLFLDEVGDLPLETQIALLRVLQEHEFERVGGTEVLHADARIIAATNRELSPAITAGLFRSDLYYRLSVFPIKLPALRERREDIPLLVNYFVDRFSKRAGKKIKNIRKKAIEALQEYSWPGNVRELQNVIERSLIVCETNEFSIDKSWLSTESMQRVTEAPAAEQMLSERQHIEKALTQTKGKVSGVSGAAAQLGMPASTLESKIRSLKINKFRFKES